MTQAKEDTWYRGGLCFECTQCGNCCGGEPGIISISPEEITALADFLGLDVKSFRDQYTRRLQDGRRSLIEKDNYDCIFYENGCTVYEFRPRQCRTWPFWDSVVESPRSWKTESSHCPGINKGRRFSWEEIQEILENDGTTGQTHPSNKT